MLTVDSRAYWAAIVRAYLFHIKYMHSCSTLSGGDYSSQNSSRGEALFEGVHIFLPNFPLCECAHIPPSYARVHIIIFLPLMWGCTSSFLLCEGTHLPPSYVRVHIFLPLMWGCTSSSQPLSLCYLLCPVMATTRPLGKIIPLVFIIGMCDDHILISKFS